MSISAKRKRTIAALGGVKKAKLQHKSVKTASKSRLVQGDALKWKEVGLPDRLDDAEGFFGLEEIDDIEIVKADDGQITFRTSNLDNVAERDSEEWSGFGEETASENVNAEPGLLPSKPPMNAKAASSDTKKATKTIKNSKNQASPAAESDFDVDEEIDFTALESGGQQVEVDVTAWRDLDLSTEMLSAISSLGFPEPTPIQRAAIPSIREGRDVIGKAVTGSGKTLAFGIPVIEKWLEKQTQTSESVAKVPVAFILAPTRELAHQLSKHLTALCRGLERAPRMATVTGGLSVIKQQRQLETADIIVGTPGRLWEVINSSHGLIARLKQAQFLVIDEADRLLSEGHFKEVEEILDVLNRSVIDEDEEGNQTRSSLFQRQTLVFSATFHKGLQQKLASKQKWKPTTTEDSNLASNAQSLEYLLRKLKFQHKIKPTFVDANPDSQMASNLTESILECGAMQKDLYLYSLLLLRQHEQQKLMRRGSSSQIDRTLVFTNSISTVKRLVPLLANLALTHTLTLPLHSAMPQKSRLRSLERFTSPPDKTMSSVVLISTDVAARGLDIKGIDTIIHYHVPRAADAYVHRSGRTARSTSSGTSILICSPEETAGVTRLISKVHANKSQGKGGATAKSSKPIQPLYLPANLSSQLTQRVTLAQKITNTQMDTSKTKSQDNWLRNAAEELGVDYSSDDFEETSTKHRRGRGGGRDEKRKEHVKDGEKGKVPEWKAELKEDLKGRRIDFGDGESVGGRAGRFLAGGAVDVERLLRDGL